MISPSCKTVQKNIRKEHSDDIYEKAPIKNKNLENEIKEWLGSPYKYGGHSKDGTDCSGMVMEIYLKIYEIKLYRNSKEIFKKNCKRISKKDLQEGDLVFFGKGDVETINHVGIYLYENKFVHASTSKGVMINNLSEPYYSKRFVGAGRVLRD